MTTDVDGNIVKLSLYSIYTPSIRFYLSKDVAQHLKH